MKMENREPKIVCFVCNFAFCQDEIELPDNVNVARVNCIGRLDPVTVVEMFEKGIDAVMLAGCKPPDCHFVEGNAQAELAVRLLKKFLLLAGLEPNRIKLVWYSPVEEENLGDCVSKYYEEVKEFSNSLESKQQQPEFVVNLSAIKNAFSNFQLRVLLGREKELTEGVNVYGEKLSQGEFDTLLDDIVKTEFIRQKIYVLARCVPMSIKGLSESTNLKSAEVLGHIVNMRRKNLIAFDHLEGQTPFYKALEVN